MSIEPTRKLQGTNVLRIVWMPGTDRLRGICHCGGAHEASDPTALWEWLLAHPIGHDNSSEPHAPLPTLPAEPCERSQIARHPAPA